jgi:hypothetical protein
MQVLSTTQKVDRQRIYFINMCYVNNIICVFTLNLTRGWNGVVRLESPGFKFRLGQKFVYYKMSGPTLRSIKPLIRWTLTHLLFGYKAVGA